MSGAMPAVQRALLVTLRVALGWHLFLQGVGKYVSATWSARAYLAAATGPFAAWFHALAADARALTVVDALTTWLLMVLGLLLMVGLAGRVAAVTAALLLSAFYSAAPPVSQGMVVPTVDGTEWVVNKLVIEVLALLVTATFATDRVAGLAVLLPRAGGVEGVMADGDD